jgi:hypothetical protein
MKSPPGSFDRPVGQLSLDGLQAHGHDLPCAGRIRGNWARSPLTMPHRDYLTSAMVSP